VRQLPDASPVCLVEHERRETSAAHRHSTSLPPSTLQLRGSVVHPIAAFLAVTNFSAELALECPMRHAIARRRRGALVRIELRSISWRLSRLTRASSKETA